MPKPVAALPNGITGDYKSGYSGTVFDTTFTPPTGQTFACHTALDLKNALAAAKPGDCIQLDPATVYSGNFIIPALPQAGTPQYLHITTAGFHAKHPTGTRVSAPTDAQDMGIIVTPNAVAALRFTNGPQHSSYVRIYGVELYSVSTYIPPNYGSTTARGYGYGLIQNLSMMHPIPEPMPDHIIFDRCYIHGSPTVDLQQAVQANFNFGAVIDSWIDEIHMRGTDTQAVACWYADGPLKVVNNFLSAAGENVLFGGAGGPANPHVPSDLEIRDNWIYKPLSWVLYSVASSPWSANISYSVGAIVNASGLVYQSLINQNVNQPPATSPAAWRALPNAGMMVVKNSVEFKSAQRVLLDSNLIENKWNAGQVGGAVVLTVRTSQSGDIAVVKDMTITNNILKNIVRGIDVMESDYNCGITPYLQCRNAGSTARINITNNLVGYGDPAQPGYNNGQFSFILFTLGADMTASPPVNPPVLDVVCQHNTAAENPNAAPWGSVYFSFPGSWHGQILHPVCENLWFLDNVIPRQPNGDHGCNGTPGLIINMGTPTTPGNDVNARYTGNVMGKSVDPARTWPVGNDVPLTITFKDPASGDYTLSVPAWSQTTDGALAGVDMALLPGGKPAGPPAPTAVTAVPVIIWQGSNTAGATFNLYRGAAAGAEGATPYQKGLTATTFADTAVAPGQLFFYQVTEVDVNGVESPRSAEVSR